jgi:hypothetical protein
MNTALARDVKSAFIFLLVVSVVLGAMAAIAAVLQDDSNFVDRVVLPTCLSIAWASACGIACTNLAIRRGRTLPVAGILLALTAATLQIAGVWIGGLSVDYWNMTWSLTFFGVACAHCAALSLARLAPWHLWCLVMAYVLVFGVASLGALRLLTGYGWTPWSDQAFIVMIILDVAVTILVPCCHWLSRDYVALEAFDAFARHASVRVASAEPQFTCEE